jgi:PAS domain S-box-containing protein
VRSDPSADVTDPIHILIVDDRPEDVLVLEDVLNRADYQVVSAASGEDALEKVAATDFAIIVMDAAMPSMDGLETARRIAATAKGDGVPVIFLTATGEDVTSLARGYALGTVDFLNKPIDAAAVRAKVAVFADLYRKARHIQRQESALRAIERQRSEVELREREAEYEATFEKAPAGIAHVAADGRWLRVNEKLCDIIGYSKRQALELRLQDVAHPDDAAEQVAAMARILARELPSYRRELRVMQRDGSSVWVDLTLSPLRAGGEGRGTLIAVVEDINVRKRSEKNRRVLARAGEILLGSLDIDQTLAATARSAVPDLADWCAIDIVRTPSSKTPRYFVAHANATLVQLAHEIRLLYPPDSAAGWGAWHVMQTGRSELHETVPEDLVVRTARDGEHMRLLRRLGMKSAIAVPIVARNRTLGAITLISAESGRRLCQDDLEVAEELARRIALAVDNAGLYQDLVGAVRAREQMLAIVSHDLRNPLSAVSLRATQIERLAPGPENGEQIRRTSRGILRSVERMTQLIQSLLDLAKLEAGQQLPIDPKPEDAGDILQQAIGTLEPVVAEAPGRLLCDAERLQQVLSNLIGNAIKFTPKGGSITVRARRAPGELVFSVSDTGIGIADDHLPRLFDPYYQETAQRDGVGLGLAIAKGIVDAHGGRVWVETELGRGSSFFFALPTSEGARRAATADPPGAARAGESGLAVVP